MRSPISPPRSLLVIFSAIIGSAAAVNSSAPTSAHFWCGKAADGSCDYQHPDQSMPMERMREHVRKTLSAGRPTAAQKKVDASTIRSKVLAGYQGWAGARAEWDHWSKDTKQPDPAAKNEHFEMVPQAGEYPRGALRDTGFKYNGNSSAVPLYENTADGVVDLHFRWMADYGLDGVLLQRFISECTSPGPALTQRNTILKQVDAAARKHGRVYGMMWDISGASAHWDADIKRDYNNYVLNYTTNPRYVRENGRPVVCIFGIGLLNHEQATAASALALIQWLQKQGLYVIGSGPYFWRTGDRDALKGFDKVHAAFDAIMPWAVGRYNTAADFQNSALPVVQGDVQLTRGRGQDYAPIAYAGYSYRDSGLSKVNYIKRNGGTFFTAQTSAFLKLDGATFYYIAMFDEVQEGTAIYKFAANNSESAAGRPFVTASSDGVACPGDFYLTLAGQYTAAAKGHPTPPPSPLPPSPTPSPPTPPPPAPTDHLSRGHSLQSGDHLVSASGKARLEMQSDGNCVLYSSGGAVIWSSDTQGHQGAHLDFQKSDGNLVLYDSGSTHALWSSGVPQGDPVLLQLQDDCNLVMKSFHFGEVVWSLGTTCA